MKRLLLALLALLLIGCQRGPDTGVIENDLRARLAETFPNNEVSLQQLQRLGSANDAHANAGETRRIVYFKADLLVGQDQDFGSWDAPGVASMVSLLGTGPRGLSGIKSGGNARGDVLTARGSMIYRTIDGRWEPVVPQGYQPPRLANSSEGGPSSQADQLTSAITTALNLSPGGTSVAARRIINEEASRSLENIRGRISRLENGFPLASGPDQGQYARFANAWSDSLKHVGIKLQPLVTTGGVENLILLRDDLTVLALSQSDVAFEAFTGAGSFSADRPDERLRALASLFPEPMHVLVNQASALRRITDLRGQRVSLGQAGSGSRQTALAVLAAHGLSSTDIVDAGELNLSSALQALQHGQIDAHLQVIGSPADQIRAAVETLGLRFLPLDDEAIEVLTANRPGTFAHTLQAGTYPLQNDAVATIAVSGMLLSNQSLTDSEAATIIHQLFDPATQWLQKGSIQGSQLSAAQATRGITIPMHPGAEQALKALRPAAE